MKKKVSQKREICWNIVNSLLAGSLIFLGTIIDGDVNLRGTIIAVGGAAIVAITKFRDYWETQEEEYCHRMFVFIG